MNLHGIVSGAIGAVNPLITLAVQISTGYQILVGGKQRPAYAPLVFPKGQLQPLTYNELRQLDALNIQGIRRAIYINGVLDGLVRPDKKGGDLIATPDSRLWLVVLVLEQWPDWVKVAVTLQNETATTADGASLDFSNPDNSQYLPGLGP